MVYLGYSFNGVLGLCQLHSDMYVSIEPLKINDAITLGVSSTVEKKYATAMLITLTDLY